MRYSTSFLLMVTFSGIFQVTSRKIESDKNFLPNDFAKALAEPSTILTSNDIKTDLNSLNKLVLAQQILNKLSSDRYLRVVQMEKFMKKMCGYGDKKIKQKRERLLELEHGWQHKLRSRKLIKICLVAQVRKNRDIRAIVKSDWYTDLSVCEYDRAKGFEKWDQGWFDFKTTDCDVNGGVIDFKTNNVWWCQSPETGWAVSVRTIWLI